MNQILTYVNESIALCDEEGVNFVVSDLETMCKKLLQERDINYMPTHFTNELLVAIPKLEKRLVGSKVTLFLRSDLDESLLEELMNVKLLNKVIKPIRKAMLFYQNSFDGTFKPNCQENFVPIELLTLVNMTVEGTNIDAKITQSSHSCAKMMLSDNKPDRRGQQ